MSLTQFIRQSKNRDVDLDSLVYRLCTQNAFVGSSPTLLRSIFDLSGREKASFHMPGHKGVCDFYSPEGREKALSAISVFEIDTTELSGLDDLTCPVSLIKSIESGLAEAYGAEESFITLGGASHGLLAAMMSVAAPGKFVLVPRNTHRSVVNGLVLSGMDLVWYDPVFDSEWGIWGALDPSSIEARLSDLDMTDCAAMVVVSPTYGGAVSDIGALRSIVRRNSSNSVPLVVDEAHGAHFLPGVDAELPVSAVALGADLVVHSLHKSMPGLTQTGVIHRPRGSLVKGESVKAALRLVTSSSPSYPMLVSMEIVAGLARQDEFLAGLKDLVEELTRLRKRIKNLPGLALYEPQGGFDPLHILFRSKFISSGKNLADSLESKGVFIEGSLGNGCLALAGVGTRKGDLEILEQALQSISESSGETFEEEAQEPIRLKQVMNPREAFFSDCEIVEYDAAVGRISAECVSPCPPGIPVLSPGSEVPPGLESSESVVRSVRVVKS